MLLKHSIVFRVTAQVMTYLVGVKEAAPPVGRVADAPAAANPATGTPPLALVPTETQHKHL